MLSYFCKALLGNVLEDAKLTIDINCWFLWRCENIANLTEIWWTQSSRAPLLQSDLRWIFTFTGCEMEKLLHFPWLWTENYNISSDTSASTHILVRSEYSAVTEGTVPRDWDGLQVVWIDRIFDLDLEFRSEPLMIFKAELLPLG
jgi:hypothetical protein